MSFEASVSRSLPFRDGGGAGSALRGTGWWLTEFEGPAACVVSAVPWSSVSVLVIFGRCGLSAFRATFRGINGNICSL